jgi:HD-GYP domain-containing protein (c-di-GMP phosphodiesterase class II)
VEEEELISKEEKNLIKRLNKIGIALSSEKNMDRLLEMILDEAKSFTSADGGTLYLKSDDGKHLNFKVVKTDSLRIAMGGTKGPINWPPLPLYLEDGKPNISMVAVTCALIGDVINIEDVYDVDGFNFDGTRKFDEGTGYRSKSMLVVPLRDNENEIIGVLQLLNRRVRREKLPFTKENEHITLSLASQAAMAINNARLINDLEALLMAFIQTIATAIDEKSPYTGGHIKRVAQITEMIASAINEDTESKYKDINFDADDMKMLKISAWMHDIGKITTPEYVVDKANKLETIFDRIAHVKSKFELLKSQTELEYSKKKIALLESGDIKSAPKLDQELKEKLATIEDDKEFIVRINKGGEFMADELIERLNNIATYKIIENGIEENLLSENEVYNLAIRKGTLTDEERLKINDHAKLSLRMLEKLPFPKKLQRVVDTAANHHEKLSGKGYPRGLDESQLTLESRILAISDIFEALTASDRPYKDAKKLSECMKILSFMAKDREIDSDLLRFFYDKGLHMEYANKELKEEQIDESKLLI